MKKLLVCTNSRVNPNTPSCAARGSELILSALSIRCRQNNLDIHVEESPCLGFCTIGPNAHLVPSGAFFHEMLVNELDPVLLDIKEFCQPKAV